MKNQKLELLFTRMCLSAFYDGEYSHFSWNDIKKSYIPKQDFKNCLTILEDSNIIKNHTIRGYYSRYKIQYIDCPSFIFDTRLGFSIKLFLLSYYTNYSNLSINHSYEEMSIDLSFKKTSIYKFKFILMNKTKLDINQYLSNINFMHLHPTHDKYRLIKKDNGYQIDTEYDKRINNILLKSSKPKRNIYHYSNDGSIGNFLFKKVRRRILANKERFVETDITEQYLNDLFNHQKGCDFYTGKPFNDYKKISVDRINSSLPYNRSNIVLTTNEINRLKGCLSLHDFIELCNTISNNFPMF